MFLKNKNIIFKIRKSKVTDYAALSLDLHCLIRHVCFNSNMVHTFLNLFVIQFIVLLFSSFSIKFIRLVLSSCSYTFKIP